MNFYYISLFIFHLAYVCSTLNQSYVEYEYFDQNGRQIINPLGLVSTVYGQTTDYGGYGRHKRYYTNSPEFLYIESRDSLVIGASLNIHISSPKNPLQCGPIDSLHGIQHVEAFLWAHDMIRAHPEILPGVELGAIILDTCSSHQKTARDVSNFFSNALAGEEHPNLPAAESVVGFIVDGDNSKIVDAVVDVTNPFEITTLAALSRDSKYNDRDDYPLLLRLSTPNDVYADAIISILVRFLWHYVSLVYESTPQMIDIFHELKIKSNFLGIEYAMEEEMGSNGIYGNHIISIINSIRRNAKNGSKVVILLLSNEQIRRLFQENKNLPPEHQIKIGEIQWISIEGKEVFPDFTEQSLGVITIGQQLSAPPTFKTYFTSLGIRNNTRNPWFHEYWEVLFNCRGNQCLNPAVSSSHIPADVAIDRDTSQTINAMFALANALELTRRALCPQSSEGLCPEFRRHTKLSKVVYDMAKSAPFLAYDNRQMVFDPESGYAISSLFIHNLRLMSQKSLVWLNVGVFTVHDGLTLNVTKARAYNTSGDEIPLSQVKSVCTDSHCSQLIPESTAIQPSMTIAPTGGLTIGAIIPLHKPGTEELLECGPIDDVMFENLLAFNYALEMVNKNHSILPNIELGAVVFDDCGHKEIAKERLLSFLTSQDSTKIPAKTLVSMITYNENSTQELQHILDEKKVVHLRAPPVLPTEVSNKNTPPMKSSPIRRHEIQTIVNLLTEFEWSLVNLIYSDENLKNIFVVQSNKLKVCVDFMFALSEDMTNEEVKKDLNIISNKSESKVIVVLGNAKINSMVLGSASDHMLKNYIWIGGQSWKESLNKSESTRLPLNSLSLTLESYSDPNFLKYLSSLSLIDHNSIPVNWFHQYYQQKFGCHLIHSPVIDTRFEHICTGEERLEHIDGIHSDNIQSTIGLVNGIAGGIRKFLMEKCQITKLIEDIDSCPDNPREKLRTYIQNELEHTAKDKQNKIQSSVFSFNIWKKTNGKDLKIIGVSRDNTIDVKKKITEFSQIKAYCVRNCRKCETQFETSSQQLLLSERIPPTLVTLRRTWSLFASIMSALGVISVLICVIYFLLVFPLAIGTTALGYQILFGLFLAFSTNFVFLIPVSMTVCSLRRLGLSLSYTIIISGLLVKVLNTWRLMIVKSSAQPLRLTSPLALVFISSGLIFLQIILTTIWLLSYAPNPGLYDGLWKCSPNKSLVLFDSEIIVSLLYVIQLLLITIFFAALTWKCYDQNREPRWIMGCALSTALVWLCWFIFSVGSADPTMSIVCANLINSSIIMLLLYIRKLYLFTKISRQIRKDRKMKNSLQHEPFAGHQQFYGAVKSSSISGAVDWSDREIVANQLRGATRAPFEGDYDDNISSCGSVKSSASAQVQCHDLYPMEVYDGGSQFAPLSSLFSQSNRSIYGLRDDKM